MKESTEKFLKKMKEDKGFAEKILTQTENEKVIELAAAEGINITLEDLDEVNSVIRKSIEVQKLKSEGELTEEELERVAGGLFIFDDALLWTATLAITGMLSVITTISGASVSVAVTVTVNKSNND